jgi:cytochrome c-type biogenesis protein CcmH/NrfF
MGRVSLKQIGLALACCAAVLVGLFLPRAQTVLAAAVVSFQDLEESLTCQCGCGLTVHACNHLQCPSAGPLREEIRAQMALGKSKAEILAYFRNKYGEKILSAPTTTGFNVVAWVMPFALVILGGLIVGLAIMRWSGRAQQESPAEQGPARPPSPYDKILERELKDFEA